MMDSPDVREAEFPISREMATRELLGNPEFREVLLEAVDVYEQLLGVNIGLHVKASGRKLQIDKELQLLEGLKGLTDYHTEPEKRVDASWDSERGGREALLIFGPQVPGDGRRVNQLEIKVEQIDSRVAEERQLAAAYRREDPQDIYHRPSFIISLVCQETHMTLVGYRHDVSVGVELALDQEGGLIMATGLTHIGATPHHSPAMMIESEIKDWPAVREKLTQIVS